MEKYPSITWVPCGAHPLNLLLKYIGQQSFVQTILQDANFLMNFIKSHQYLHAIFQEHSSKQLHQIFQTRFATSFMVLKRLMEVCQALIEIVVDRC